MEALYKNNFCAVPVPSRFLPLIGFCDVYIQIQIQTVKRIEISDCLGGQLLGGRVGICSLSYSNLNPKKKNKFFTLAKYVTSENELCTFLLPGSIWSSFSEKETISRDFEEANQSRESRHFHLEHSLDCTCASALLKKKKKKKKSNRERTNSIRCTAFIHKTMDLSGPNGWERFAHS